MKFSTIILIVALGTLGQATWPPPLSASKLTTHSLSDHAPLETISLPIAPSVQTSSSSHQSVGSHSLPILPAGQSSSTHPSGAAISLSSPPTAHTPSSHSGVVYHTLPSPPMANNPSSHKSVAAYSRSSLSQLHSSFSRPNATVTPLSGLSSARTSTSQPLTVTTSAGDVDHDVMTHTVTEDRVSTETVTVTDHEAPATCKKPSPTTWDPPRSPIRSYAISTVNISRSLDPTPWDPPRRPHETVRPYSSDTKKHQAVPTPWDPPHRPYGTVRPYPPDNTEKHKTPTYSITVREPEPTCPPGFTCQPDDDHIENKLAVREAKVPWPAPPGCENHCVGGQGCWTECDKPRSTKSQRVCPEGYSCQRPKLPAPDPAPAPSTHEQQPPHEQRPAPEKKPTPPAAYPGTPPVPAPLAPSPHFIPPPVVQPPPAPPSSVVLPLPASPSAVQPLPVVPQPVISPPPPAFPDTAPRPPIAPAPAPVPLDPATPPRHCPNGMHPCPHPYANETFWKPDTVTKADAGLSVPNVSIYVMIVPFVGLFMA